MKKYKIVFSLMLLFLVLIINCQSITAYAVDYYTVFPVGYNSLYTANQNKYTDYDLIKTGTLTGASGICPSFKLNVDNTFINIDDYLTNSDFVDFWENACNEYSYDFSPVNSSWDSRTNEYTTNKIISTDWTATNLVIDTIWTMEYYINNTLYSYDITIPYRTSSIGYMYSGSLPDVYNYNRVRVVNGSNSPYIIFSADDIDLSSYISVVNYSKILNDMLPSTYFSFSLKTFIDDTTIFTDSRTSITFSGADIDFSLYETEFSSHYQISRNDFMLDSFLNVRSYAFNLSFNYDDNFSFCTWSTVLDGNGVYEYITDNIVDSLYVFNYTDISTATSFGFYALYNDITNFLDSKNFSFIVYDFGVYDNGTFDIADMGITDFFGSISSAFNSIYEYIMQFEFLDIVLYVALFSLLLGIIMFLIGN